MKKYKIKITEEQIGKIISPLDNLNKEGGVEKSKHLWGGIYNTMSHIPPN